MEVADLMVGAPAHALDEEEHDAVEHEDDKENGEKFGEFGLNRRRMMSLCQSRSMTLTMPWLILRGQGQKVHDYGVSLSGML